MAQVGLISPATGLRVVKDAGGLCVGFDVLPYSVLKLESCSSERRLHEIYECGAVVGDGTCHA